jgi:catechol 2,3-dioxygenase-like lactoylglutathione lyase family enzyme
MKFSCPVIAVKDITLSRKFYEDLFDLNVVSDYGINITFDCGLALQQDFDWLTHIPKDEIIYKANTFELCFEEADFDSFTARLKGYPEIVLVHDVFEHTWGQRVIRFYDLDEHIIEVGEDMKVVVQRFLTQGLSIEETAKRMDISAEAVQLILNGAGYAAADKQK